MRTNTLLTSQSIPPHYTSLLFLWGCLTHCKIVGVLTRFSFLIISWPIVYKCDWNVCRIRIQLFHVRRDVSNAIVLYDITRISFHSFSKIKSFSNNIFGIGSFVQKPLSIIIQIWDDMCWHTRNGSEEGVTISNNVFKLLDIATSSTRSSMSFIVHPKHCVPRSCKPMSTS